MASKPRRGRRHEPDLNQDVADLPAVRPKEARGGNREQDGQHPTDDSPQPSEPTGVAKIPRSFPEEQV